MIANLSAKINLYFCDQSNNLFQFIVVNETKPPH